MNLGRIWPNPWLLLNFLKREIQGRYVGSFSGLFWAFIHPLALLAVYALVFTAIFRVKFPELEGHGFTVFVALALWPWLAFQESVQRGAMAVTVGASLIKKVAFPHALLVHASVLATYAVHGAGFLLVLLVLHLSGSALHFGGLPLVLAIFLVQLIWTSGIALFLAALQVLIKDIEHFLAPVFLIWFYATPVLYPQTLVPPQIQQVIAINPMTYFVERMREVLMFGSGPVWQDLGMLALSVAVFALGRGVFNRLSPHFEDFL